MTNLWSILVPKFTDWITNCISYAKLNVKVCCYLYLLKHVFELNQELLGIFSFVRDAVQRLGNLTLQRQTEKKDIERLRCLKRNVTFLLMDIDIHCCTSLLTILTKNFKFRFIYQSMDQLNTQIHDYLAYGKLRVLKIKTQLEQIKIHFQIFSLMILTFLETYKMLSISFFGIPRVHLLFNDTMTA